MITHTELRSVLHYEPTNGRFVWLKDPDMGPRRRGQEAGFINMGGRRVIKIGQRKFYAARLAWFYMTAEWPPEFVDHINLNPADDRWSNLRLATRSQNMANRRSWTKHGLKGVRLEPKTGRWVAVIRKDKISHYLGIFKTPEEAHQTYMAKARELHGEYARE